MAQWLKVEPKQSTLFFKTFISFSMLEDKVEHAIGVQEVEATLAWQTSISFCKDLFLIKTKSNSFEIESILFFKVRFSLKTQSNLEDKTSLCSTTSSQSFFFSKLQFLLKQFQVEIQVSHVH